MLFLTQPPPRHKVFVSFHHEDQEYKDLLVRLMGDDIVDKSVEDGDIDNRNLKVETIRQKIRDDFIADATVTVVLIGPCTWQRKHVDWEIGSSLTDTKLNSRCGLLGMLLPNHSSFRKLRYNAYLVPPRLGDNCTGPNSYACIYDWPDQDWSDRQATDRIRRRVHTAFQRRNGAPPDNSRDQFAYNIGGDCLFGWWD